MPREPAYAVERSHDGEATAASERATGRMPDASVRRRGMGGSEPHAEPAAWEIPLMRLLVIAVILVASSAVAAAGEPSKNLVVPGEVFTVGDRTAFIFTPHAAAVPAGPKPWILYGPTLAAYPDTAERWMHEQFTKAGVAVAGIDSGESYGSPDGLTAMEALHADMVRRGYATKPAFLGRSRGGLWASSWAIAHPDLTAGVGGIYPVYDWRSYPGLEKAAPAYGLTPAELAARAADLCPIERIDVAAKGGVPFWIIHGGDDALVPIGPNSAALKARYAAAGRGDLITLVVAEGQGHSMWEGFFRCEGLVEFLITRAKAAAADHP